jgi:hypothetical protein
MFKSIPTSPSLRPTLRSALRAAATLAVLTGCIAFADAQTAQVAQLPALDTSATQLFSSSSDQTPTADGTTAEASLNPVSGVNFANYMQYGGGQRRRYGQPRYRGNNTNADGSPKYTFLAGVGLVQPLGNTYHYLTPSYGLQVGGGRNFNKNIGVLLQFDYDHFGFTGQTLSNQSYIYFHDSNPSDNGLDGSSHIWSFTLNPVFNLFSGDKGGMGAYLVAGAGFYHKVANFTTPQEAVYCYYYCSTYAVNSTYDHYTSNAPGFSGGFGLTYKFSRFSNERFYDDSQRHGVTYATVATAPPTSTDFYPANSNKTTYVPIKVGLRF